jgi:NitT/TauT family transport system substrate-binding protein
MPAPDVVLGSSSIPAFSRQAGHSSSPPALAGGAVPAGLLTRRSVLVGAGLMTLAATGCSAASSTSPAAVEKPQLRVAVVPAVTNMGLFLAQQKGFFAAEGLKVKIVPVQSSTTALAGQLRGEFDVTGGAYVSYVLSQSKNPSVISWHILSEGSISQQGSQSVLVAKNSAFRTVADLKGQTVAANILNNVGTLLIQSMLAENSIPVSSVKLVQIPFPDMASALAAGRIAAGWFDEPFLSQAQATIGAETLFDTDQGSTSDFPISGYMSTKAWVAKYPATASAFIRAITRGQVLADASRAADEQACAKSIKGVSPDVASILTFDQYPTGVDPVRIQRVADVMHEFGVIGKTFNMSVMV